MSISSEILQKLSPQAREKILAQQSRAGINEQSTNQTRGPATSSQARLYNQYQLAPYPHHFHHQRLDKISGQLEIDKWQDATACLIQIHPILRTLFQEHPDGLRQSLTAAIRCPLVTAHEWSSKDLSAELDRYWREPFTLSEQPPFRWRLLQLGADEYLLQVVVHAIASDRHSLFLFRKHLAELYEGRSLPSPTKTSLTLALQEERLPDAVRQYALAAWQDYLQGPGPAKIDIRGSGQTVHSLTIEPELSALLSAQAEQCGLTPFTLFLGYFKILLSGLTAQSSVTVGTQLCLRPEYDCPNLMGNFLSPLQLVSSISSKETILQTLVKVSRATWEMLSLPAVSWEQITEQMGAEGAKFSRFPIFLNYWKSRPAPMQRLNGASVESLPGSKGVETGDIRIEVVEEATSYRIDIHCAAEACTVENLMAQWLMLLKAGVSQPNTVIGDLRIEPSPLFTEEQTTTLKGPVPEGATECRLATLWSNLLGIERVGATENFFQLGGRSLVAVQLVSSIRDEFEVDFSLGDLLANPTVQEQSRLLESRPRSYSEPIPSTLRPAALPLSFAQQRLWLLEQMGHGQAYLIPRVFVLQGPLNVYAFEAALKALMERHESLRTRIVSGENGPEQVIDTSFEIPLTFQDFQERTEAEQESALQSLLETESRLPFQLDTGSLLRLRLVKLKQDKYQLFCTTHHIATDGWSMGIFWEEFWSLYESFRRGRPAALKPLSIQYADYACWQRSRFQEGAWGAPLAYWREALKEAPTTLSLPRNRPSQLVQARAGWIPCSIDAEVVIALRQIDPTASLFTLLLAAFQVLLSRHSGQSDLVIGSPVANRERKELQPLIGFFVNLIPLRGDLRGDPTFLEHVQKIKEVVQQAIHHQVPFESIVETMLCRRAPDIHPLVQVILAYEETSWELENQPAELRVEPQGFRTAVARFELELHLRPARDSLEGGLIYNAELYEKANMRRLLDQFSQLLANLGEAPTQRIHELSLLSSSELEQVLKLGEPEQQPFPFSKKAVDLFQQQVELSPTTIALHFVSGDFSCELSYQLLNQKANQLAHYLIAQGLSGHLVGIHLERSPDLLISILATHKAGGAYLPLDPSYPRERLDFMVADSAVKVVIGRSDDSWLPNAPTLLIDQAQNDWEASSSNNPGAAHKPDELAYILYTSGSTGRPKGVRVSHRSLTNFVTAMALQPGMTPQDKLLAVTTVSFDMSLFELFVPLAVGAEIFLMDQYDSRDSRKLARVLTDNEITVMQATPALWQAIVAEGWKGHPELKIVCGGEAITTELRRALETRCGSFWNGYGPTEATVYATVHQILPHEDRVFIGRPVRNTQSYILDSGMVPVPIGAPGELYLGGEGLAQGYHGRDQLTEDRFPANPFGPGRLYRTGDQVRYQPDGKLEYLGRIDNQVKVRGHRLELGEVEALLRQHALVEDAVVTVSGDSASKQILAAFIRVNKTAIDIEPQLSHWRSIFEQSYEDNSEFSEWRSSYNGDALPYQQMKTWQSGTLEAVRKTGMKRVAELGCGRGLILKHLVPACEHYCGIEPSETALRELRVWKGASSQRNHLVIRQGWAHELELLPNVLHDGFILNSVVQYFPGKEYLLELISKLMATLEPGGALFFGDIRNYDLLETFHAFRLDQRFGKCRAQAELQERLVASISDEPELFLSPGFFLELPRENLSIERIEVELQRGKTPNELNQFRYHVIIYKKQDSVGSPRAEWKEVPWSQISDLNVLRKILGEKKSPIVVRGVPNARLVEPALSLRKLKSEIASSPLPSLEPELLWALAEECGWQLNLSWSEELHEMDAFFRPVDWPAEIESPYRFPSRNRMNSEPLTRHLAVELVPQLEGLLAKRLPQPLLPSNYQLVDSWPLTPSGKVDRSALAERANTSQSRRYKPAEPVSNSVENLIAEIWCEVLGHPSVFRNDNFFQLGGNSLAATQVVSRIYKKLSVELPLRSMMNASNLAELAQEIQRLPMAQSHSVPRLPDNTPSPLSFAQRRLWFLDWLGQGSAYNVPYALEFEGDLDSSTLEKALSRILHRHTVLRTRFIPADGEPDQVVTAAEEFRLQQIDCRQMLRKQIESIIRAEAESPFDLERGPLMRTKLLKVEDKRHLFLCTFHHIAFDGWSQGVFQRELKALYAAYLERHSDPLPSLPLQYRDFAAWQRLQFCSDNLDSHLKYWKEQLNGSNTVLDLPLDRPRPANRTSEAGAVEFDLSQELLQRLNQVDPKATLFMVLLAAFQILVARYSDQDDVLVGAPIANRREPEIESLIGCFVNLLALRADLSQDPSFRDFLAQVRLTAEQAYEHQDLPFEVLVENLEFARGLEHYPLFQVVFSLQNAPRNELELQGLKRHPARYRSRATRFDLELHCWPQTESDALHCYCLYSTDIFERSTIEVMMERFQRLLRAIAKNPEHSVKALPLQSPQERHLAVTEWNCNQAPFPAQHLIHELFEERVRQTPAARALCFVGSQGTETFTYLELNRHANKLAHCLIAHGLQPGHRVALFLERCSVVSICALAVLKSGGNYLPIDPQYPEARIGFLVEDTEPVFGITQARLKSQLPESSTRWLIMDELSELLSKESEENPERRQSPSDPAYMIYTSGSTGKPKGVSIPHRALTNLVTAKTRRLGLDPGDRLLGVSRFAFDMAVSDLYWPLTQGASVTLVGKNVARDGKRLASLLEEHEVTLMQATPATWSLLVGTGWTGKSDLRIISGGEALSATLRSDLETRCAELWNGYGPTETTVYTLFHRIRSEDRRVYLGRPLDNIQVYVLNAAREPVPVGVAGELFIAGAGVGLGYHARTDLTEEKFLTNPFGPGKLYRTGDRARYLSNGVLEFLGRVDDQVKVRGFRIELGEIEHHLCQHPEVRKAVALVSGQQLIAHLESDNEEQLFPDDLLKILKSELPPYMLPAKLHLWKRLPSTPNHKTDRRALGNAKPTTSVQVDLTPPQTPTEVELARLWCDVLGVDKVGADEDFFTLGGHSLLAVKLINQIEARWSTNLPVATFFDGPTVKLLAAHLDSISQMKENSELLIPLRANGPRAPLFLVPPAASLGLFFRSLVQRLPKQQPIYSFDPFEGDEVRNIAAAYLQEIRRIRPSGPYQLGGICFGGHVAYEMAQQLLAVGEEVRLLVLVDSTRPAHGPDWSQPQPDRTVGYFLGRLGHHLINRQLNSVLRQRMETWKRRAKKAVGMQSPEDRYRQILERLQKAQARYRAEPYPSSMVLIQTEEFFKNSTSQERWRSLCPEGFKHHILPDSTHFGLVNDPSVLSALADKLEELLRGRYL